MERFIKITAKRKEILFQLALNLLIFIFYAIDRRHPQVETFEVFFFLSLASFAFLVNYLLLPLFFNKKKYGYFIIGLLMIVLAAILMEELVLEQIYFPDTRGSKFSSVFYTIIEVVPVIIILVAFKLGWDLIEKQHQLEQLEAMAKESELQFLKSQINPHFLFNNLNNLYAHAIEQSPKTPDIILDLSATLRYMLYDCKAPTVSLKKEMEHIENFISISKLQIEDRGIVHFDYPKSATQYQIAPLILIVFVENAFKHSAASQLEDISIDIELKISEQGVLEFTCVNSYHEESNTDNLSSGIGLENVKKRLELLYPKTHELKIKKSNDQYSVYLAIEFCQ